MPRVFIIHGWGGSPQNDWLPWVTEQFKNLGYEVTTPVMPDTDNPKIEAWVGTLGQAVSEPQESDILIGHSIGCQTILRYLETLPENTRVNKVILVAPWVKLSNQDEENQKIAAPWENTPIDFSKVKPKANSFVCLFSDNDPWVPLKENKKLFAEKINPQIIVEHNKGHFTSEEGITELPEILNLIQ